MNKKDLRIIFMGTPDFSNQVILELIENKYNIISVYTQPDKKVGRKQEIQKSPVKITAEKNNIPIFQPLKLREEIENIRKLHPDLIIVAAYGKIIPQEILDIPKFKCINIHPSLLPKYRGASPLQNTLLNGEKETGTTIMLMAQEVDAGDILAQEKTKILPEERLPEFSQRMSNLSAKLLIKILPDWVNGKINPQKQDDSKATFCQMLDKKDGQINWNESAQEIFNRYRAFYPWPGIFTFWKEKRLRLTEIELSKKDYSDKKIGEIFQKIDNVYIQTGKGALKLKRIQLEGKKELTIDEFKNGYPNFLKNVLK